MKLRPLAWSHTDYIICNGKMAFLWWDNWRQGPIDPGFWAKVYFLFKYPRECSSCCCYSRKWLDMASWKIWSKGRITDNHLWHNLSLFRTSFIGTNCYGPSWHIPKNMLYSSISCPKKAESTNERKIYTGRSMNPVHSLCNQASQSKNIHLFFSCPNARIICKANNITCGIGILNFFSPRIIWERDICVFCFC